MTINWTENYRFILFFAANFISLYHTHPASRGSSALTCVVNTIKVADQLQSNIFGRIKTFIFKKNTQDRKHVELK